MRLNDPLVTSFIYEGEEYKIDLAFNAVLDAFDILDDPELRVYEKAEINVAILLGEDLRGVEAVNLWNYIYEQFIHVETKQIIEYDLKGNPLPVQKENKQSIDLDKDSEYIFASFMQAYQIDLYDSQGSLHWNKFKSLLNGLPSNTIMQKIIQIRLWEPSKGDSTEYKEAMKKLQQAYSLEDEDEDEDEEEVDE